MSETTTEHASVQTNPAMAEDDGGPAEVESGGATISEAVTGALSQLGTTRDLVEVEVLSGGSRPVPGERLANAGQVRVRVRRLDEYAARARGLLEELLVRMEIPAKVSVRRLPAAPSEPGPGRHPVILDINGDDLGLLIGWRGENLRALQTVLNLMTGDNEAEGRRLILDVERYRARREEQVQELARRLAHRVKRTGQPYTLDPMQAYERRIVHISLEADEGVRTESSGADPNRRITIEPTGPAQTDLPEPPELRRPSGGDRFGGGGGGAGGGWRGGGGRGAPAGGERRPYGDRRPPR